MRTLLRICAVGIAGILASCLSAYGQSFPKSTDRFALNIEKQSLPAALIEFSFQTGQHFGQLVDPQPRETIYVGPLKGKYTVDAALRRLLERTGLTFKYVSATTIAIVPELPSSPPGGDGVAAESRAREPTAETRATQSPEGHGGVGEIETVIVPGARPWQEANAAAPVNVLERREIEVSGASTVAELLKYLPQQPYTRSDFSQPGGAQFAELRGLGFDTTLVLINGRRALPSALTLNLNGFDLNTIPLAAVERIEVLSDSISVGHGADAAGGIINIELKKGFAQPQLDINYGAADGGADERRFSVAASDAQGALKSDIAFDYFERGYLLGAERDFWRDQDFRRLGGADWRMPYGNVKSLLPGNLPGLPSAVAAVPERSAGDVLTVADFLPTAGKPNLESLLSYLSIVPEAKRSSLLLQSEWSGSSAWTAFAEILYVDRSGSLQLSPDTLTAAPVPATHPFNVFHVPVVVDRLFEEIGPRVAVFDAQLLRAVAGLRGHRGEWDWEMSFFNSSETASTQVENSLDPLRVNAALNTDDPAQALNVFQRAQPGDTRLLAAMATESLSATRSYDGQQALLSLHGALFDMPAGQGEVSVTGEWRQEQARFDSVSGQSASAHLPLAVLLTASGQRTITATSAELNLPLLGSTALFPQLGRLSLKLAGRFDHYSDIGSDFNPQYSLIWRPTADLTFRTSFAESFRPPSLRELYAPAIVLPTQLLDFRRANEIASVSLISKGNADLNATDGESVVADITFSPPRLQNLQLAAAYWRVRLDDRVTLVPLSSLLADESAFPGRVVRGAPSAADIAAGRPGPLQEIDVSALNFGWLKTSGVDLSASYAVDTPLGRFAPRLSATWVHEFRTKDTPGAASSDRVDLANTALGTIPKWRAVAGIDWQGRGIGLSTTARYVASYSDTDLRARVVGTIPALMLVDAQASMNLDQLVDDGSPWRGFDIALGAINLFDRQPRFAEAGFGAGYDFSQGDLRQRYIYFKLSKRFGSRGNY